MSGRGAPVLYRGHHGPEFRRLFDQCWDEGDLLIPCPPAVTDQALGDPAFLSALSAAQRTAPSPPVLGVFTTGTTRAGPKLVLYSRQNLEASQGSILALYDQSAFDAIFCYPQPYHVFGLLLGYALARMRGLALVTGDGPYGRSHHQAWTELGGGRLLTLATPSHLLDLCAYLDATQQEPRPSYSVILGGARVDQRVWRLAERRARISRPSVGYGCTEASPGICHLPPGVAPACDGDVGWPLPHASLRPLTEGGFVLGGPGVAMAAVEAGRLTLATEHIVRDDLEPHADGRLRFRGRQDLVLNRGGEKFQLETIEAVLRARHGLEAICVEVPHQRLGSELGIVVARTADVLSRREPVYETLAEVFGRRFDPANFRAVDVLPLDACAKPDRRAATALLKQ